MRLTTSEVLTHMRTGNMQEAFLMHCHPHSQKPVKDVSTWVNGRMKLNTDIHLRAHVAKEGYRIIMKDDVISRKAAIDAILAVTGNSSVRELYEHVQEHGLSDMWSGGVNAAIDIIIALPSAQPNLDRTKISDLLEKIYSIQSVHLSTEGVIAKKYYCKQLWMELFGSEDMPTWMD